MWLAGGPPQVRGEDHLGTAVHGMADSGYRGLDAGIVGDAPLGIQGDVEIHAHEHPFAAQGNLLNRAFPEGHGQVLCWVLWR